MANYGYLKDKQGNQIYIDLNNIYCKDRRVSVSKTYNIDTGTTTGLQTITLPSAGTWIIVCDIYMKANQLRYFLQLGTSNTSATDTSGFVACNCVSIVTANNSSIVINPRLWLHTADGTTTVRTVSCDYHLIAFRIA